jgi:hypothetical protein
MHDQGKSDRSVVPKKPSNKLATATSDRDHGEPYTGTKAETPDTDKGKPTVAEHDADEGAEAVEGRGLVKENADQQNAHRTQSRVSAPTRTPRCEPRVVPGELLGLGEPGSERVEQHAAGHAP